MRTIILGSVALAAFALVGCNMQKGGEHHEVDTAAIDRPAQGVTKRPGWPHIMRKDAEKLAAHYAADGSLANPGAALVTDAASRRAAIDGIGQRPGLQARFRVGFGAASPSRATSPHPRPFHDDLHRSGDQEAANGTGNYLTVWQKQEDGSWKAVEDFITPGPAAEHRPRRQAKARSSLRSSAPARRARRASACGRRRASGRRRRSCACRRRRR